MIDPDKLRLKLLQEAEEKLNKMLAEQCCDFCDESAIYKCKYHNTLYCSDCAKCDGHKIFSRKTTGISTIPIYQPKECKQSSYNHVNCIFELLDNKNEKEVQI